MRKNLLFSLLFLCSSVLAQQGQTGDLNVLNRQSLLDGITLGQGWKYHTGDTISFADLGYDDHNWAPINPTLPVQQLAQLKHGIVWFRFPFLLDSSLPKQLGLIVHQAGASEIYLNGQLIMRFGLLSNDSSQIQAVDPKGKVVPLIGLISGKNILAVRYALEPNIFYTNIRGRQNPAFRSTLLPLTSAIELYQREITRVATSDMFRIGVFLLFFILHFAMYLYYPAKKANLYFSLFALFSLLATMIEFTLPQEMKAIFYYKYAAAVVSVFSGLFMFVAYYTVLNEKRGWIFWSIMVVIPLSAVLVELGVEGPLAVVLTNLVYIEIIRLIIKAIRSKLNGAWLFAAGAASYIIFWTLFLLGYQFGYNLVPIGDTFLFADLLFNLAVLSNLIFISIYLGIDFARTSKTLSQKLLEVEALSAKTVEQEIEKQQLLTAHNEKLEQQVKERTAELTQSMEALKSTQARLVQQEKLASLGELTAGIAHEIKNPLNFINNFSEVSMDILEEAKEELDGGNVGAAKEVLEEVKGNLFRIAFHGKRADAIVSGMMEHSHISKGELVLTDLNALTEDYLKLAYKSFRTKDASFNARIETHYDSCLGEMKVHPQEIGRALLNLFNNAFYSLQQKSKYLNGSYLPLVQVGTCKKNGKVVVSIKDNGTGIPENLLGKIYQPFFTTKPAGEGTGLALSLSYDIITKGHGGELFVNTKEGEGAEFIVHLPAN